MALLRSLLCVVVITTAVPTVWAEDAPSKPAPQAVTVQGYVEVDTEDTEGRVETVGIWDRENREFLYVVAGVGKADELKQCIGKLIEAKGTVTIDDAGLKAITVTAYTILPDDSEEPSEGDAGNEDDVPAGEGDAGDDDVGDDDGGEGN